MCIRDSYNTPDIGLVIIDGIRDMVYDINSPGESTRIISKLMQWTDDRQIHIPVSYTHLKASDIDSNAQQSPETIANLLLYLTLLSMLAGLYL